MTIGQPAQTNRQPALRVWPGVVAVLLQWLARFALPAVVPGATGLAMLGGLAGAVAVVVWWLFFSRAARADRLGAIVLMIVALGATYALNHRSMGQLWLVSYAPPVLGLAFIVWAVACRRLAEPTRRAMLIATIVIACGGWTFVRSNGITGEGAAEFEWRWSKTAEQRLVERSVEPVASGSSSATTTSTARWPGFRGPGRDGVVRGVRIETDWDRSPPVELWRRPVGPGWSSFAVHGDLIYTQEQRGEDEVVACYSATTGEPRWQHHVAARFWESQAGAGPRATPTLGGGRVYALGATGILSALDAENGSVVWSRDAARDSGAELPIWGFSGSPLVTPEAVIVATAGSLVAYDPASGEPRWFGPTAGESYCSPQLLTIDGVEQVVMPHEAGASGVDPADGALLWEHLWPGFRIVQPAITADGDLLIASERNATRRLSLSQGPGGWSIEERWTSNRLKPYFSDFVVHDGHAFGFDGSILTCMDLDNGERAWKGGRYGHGQLVLLPDQDLLLVVTEQGQLVLVEATPRGFTELARFAAIEGKTWNHPVLVDDLLLMRNSETMHAFRLSRESLSSADLN